MFENSVTYQFISNVTKGADGAITDLAALPEGSACVVNPNNTILNIAGIGAATNVRIAQRINGNLVFSPYFNRATAARRLFVTRAEQQQVTFLGYNNTAGALDDTANATYTLGIILRDTAGVLNNTPMIKTVPYYNLSGTQAELALGLLTSFDRVWSRMPRASIRCERVVTGDPQTVNDFTNGVAADRIYVTNGATGVTYADGADPVANAANGTALPAGTVVRIAGVAYRVLAGATVAGFTLDAPYKGATGMVVGGANITTQAGIVPNSTDWGIRFTGVAQANAAFDPVTDIPRPVSFELSWDRVEAPALATADLTAITYTTPAVEGEGTYKQVAYREVYTTFNEGNPFNSSYPATKYRGAADPARTYTTFVINAQDTGYTSPTTGQTPVSLYNIYVCVDPTLGADIAHFTAL
jgi:hypothetical protein